MNIYFLKGKKTSVMKKIKSVLNQMIQDKNVKKVFQRIYETKVWDNPSNNSESLSGDGSTLKNTILIRQTIVRILSEYNIKTILDIGCGDWNWMKEISAYLPDYTGIDAALNVINRNKKFQSGNIRFFNDISLSFLKKTPSKYYDLVLLRHVLEHSPTKYNVDLLKEVKRCARFALITSALHDNPETNNGEIFGGYVPVNLLRTPYVGILENPLQQIDDYCIGESKGITFINFYTF